MISQRDRLKRSASLKAFNVDPATATDPPFTSDHSSRLGFVSHLKPRRRRFPKSRSLLSLRHRSACNYQAIFTPSLHPSTHCGPDLIPISHDLWSLLDTICHEAGIHLSEFSTMDLYGKRTDVVDFGGETDYEGYEWFQDAPPRPPVQFNMMLHTWNSY